MATERLSAAVAVRVTGRPLDGGARRAPIRVGITAALTTTGLTLVSLGLGLTALPNDVPYPFAGDVVAAQWPGDYLWMYPAVLLMLSFVALMAAIAQFARPTERIHGLLGLCAAVVSAAVLLINYFLQVTVMQPSLEKSQLDGWALLTQYNPNGVFIALEELGCLLMALALLAAAPVFVSGTKVERALRWLLTSSFVSTIAALVAVSALRGTDRGDLFEVVAVCIVWLTLIIAGPLLAVAFTRAFDDEARAEAEGPVDQLAVTTRSPLCTGQQSGCEHRDTALGRARSGSMWRQQEGAL